MADTIVSMENTTGWVNTTRPYTSSMPAQVFDELTGSTDNVAVMKGVSTWWAIASVIIAIALVFTLIKLR